MSSFGGVIKLVGETQYQQALKNIIYGLKEVSSEMKLVTSQYDKNDDATISLTKQSDVLTKKMNEQKDYVDTLKLAYEELKKKGYDENSKEMSNMRVEMNKAEADFNNTEREVKELNDQIQKSQDPLEKLKNAFHDTGEEAENTAKGGFTVFKGMLSNLASQLITKATSSIKGMISNLGEWAEMSNSLREQEAKLTQVMKNTTNASDNEIKSIIDLTGAQEKLGVVSQETQLAGLQELGTYVTQKESLEKLLPVMNDMIAQQYGLGASMESASGIATMMGKVLGNGQVDALSRLGYKFDEAQKKILKFGTEEERVAMLSEIIEESVGGMNKSLAETDAGKIAIATSYFDDLKKSAGETFSTLKNKALSSISKTLLPLLEKATKSLKDMTSKIDWNAFGKKVSKAFELALDGIKWVIKNKNLFITAMKMVIGAFAISKVNQWTKSLSDSAKGFVDIIKLSKDAVKSLIANTAAQTTNTAAQVAGTTATKGLTTATTLLNNAWKSNPIGLVIGGVTALVGVIALLKGKTDEAYNSQKTYNEEMKNAYRTFEDYNNKMGELDKSRQEYLDKGLSEIDYYESLYKELQVLTDANGKVQSGYEDRAKFIVSTLNDSLGTEIQMTDGVIKKYDKLEDSINNVIEAKRAQTLIEANEESYNEARNKKVEIENEYGVALSNNKQREEERNVVIQQMADYLGIGNQELSKFIEENGNIDVSGLTEYYNKVTDNIDVTTNLHNVMSQLDFIKLKRELMTTSEAFSESNNLLIQARDTYDGNRHTIGQYELALEHLQNKNYTAVTSIYEDTHTFIGKTTEDTYNNYQREIEIQEDYLKELKENKNGYDKEYLERETKKTEKIIENLREEQKQYVSITKDGLDKVTIEWKDSLSEQLSEITNKTVDFKEASDGNMEMYINGILSGKTKSKDEMAKLITETINEISKQETKSEDAGKNLITGINNGIANQSMQNSVFKTISNFGSKLLNRLRSSLQEHSPSKATNEMGQFLDLGIVEGIKKKTSTVMKEVHNFGKNVLNGLDSEISNKNKIRITPEVDKPDFSSISRMTKQVSVPIEKMQNSMVSDFKKALSEMKIVMDGDEVGRLVDKTVTKLIYE